MFQLPPPEDDGLFIREVGEWSSDKHHFLRRYIDAFTNAMKDKNWNGLHYVDLFAGAGLERLKTSNKLDWGSALIAAQAPHPFTRLHLCDMNRKYYDALKERVHSFRPDSQILHGDANEKIHEIVAAIPSNTLTLAFLDPCGLHLDYETLRVLSQKRADLIIFFPDHLDVLRNWETYYWDNPESNLDTCLGKGVNWRSRLAETPRDQLIEVLRTMYTDQLRKLGYTEFHYERISAKGHPLYRLIFCSRNAIAAKLWQGISSKKPDGQRTFDF